MKLSIVSVIYREPEWAKTRECIEAVRDKVQEIVYVDRGGVGSLAKAYNDGFVHLSMPCDLVWFVSNITFAPNAIERLISSMNSYGAIHPCFDSDHPHIRPVSGCNDVIPAPFVEFTAPVVRYDLFDAIRLDEQMPYWGHDLDWSYRVKHAGYELGIDHGVSLGHVYLRNSHPHPITRKRKMMRRKYDAPTRTRLKELYGDRWRGVLFPGYGSSVTKFYENVSNQILK